MKTLFVIYYLPKFFNISVIMKITWKKINHLVVQPDPIFF